MTPKNPLATSRKGRHSPRPGRRPPDPKTRRTWAPSPVAIPAGNGIGAGNGDSGHHASLGRRDDDHDHPTAAPDQVFELVERFNTTAGPLPAWTTCLRRAPSHRRAERPPPADRRQGPTSDVLTSDPNPAMTCRAGSPRTPMSWWECDAPYGGSATAEERWAHLRPSTFPDGRFSRIMKAAMGFFKRQRIGFE